MTDAAYYAAHRDEILAKVRAYQAAHPEVGRAYYVAHREKILRNTAIRRDQRKYGVAADWRERTYEAQGGRCAICEKPFVGQRVCIDHDHTTGKARALLCDYCNSRLSGLENSDWLARAQSYLQAHR